MSVNVTRPINGISINGNEFLLDDSGDPMIFDNQESTKSFLMENGIDKDDLDCFNYPEHK